MEKVPPAVAVEESVLPLAAVTEVIVAPAIGSPLLCTVPEITPALGDIWKLTPFSFCPIATETVTGDGDPYPSFETFSVNVPEGTVSVYVPPEVVCTDVPVPVETIAPLTGDPSVKRTEPEMDDGFCWSVKLIPETVWPTVTVTSYTDWLPGAVL